ncbi:MAG: 23S rRNA (pseudouridine(1915)-N(3))-methyltransferase RlmH [Clostridia bacterium]|nr:23S rRNA (pseudouridine(1915)-N(3))-methyltransferase RlmH [Clostridia bacterium]
MLKIKIITVGALSEPHWKAACDEYKKRLSSAASITEVCLKEARLPQDPKDAEIAKVLDEEGERILKEIPKRALVIPLCVEGKRFSSEALAEKVSSALSGGKSELCFIVGSSYGLSEKVKAAGDFKLSMSDLTFPHQLARVMLYETVYRTLSILSGSKYHK